MTIPLLSKIFPFFRFVPGFVNSFPVAKIPTEGRLKTGTNLKNGKIF